MKHIIIILGCAISISGMSQTLAPASTPFRKAVIKADTATIKDATKDLDKISIFASGDIRGVASTQTVTNPSGNNSSTLPSTASGSLGIRWNSKLNTVSAQISIASTADTLKNNFAASLLNPSSGKALGSGLIDWIWMYHESKSWHTYASFSSRLWEIDATRTRSASIMGLGILHRWSPVSGTIGTNTNVELNLELGLSVRMYGGNIRNLLTTPDDLAAYMKVFPTQKRFFAGLEGGFSLAFGDVVGALQLYYYPKRGEFLGGLNDLQFSFGISVNTNVISDLVK